jgi:O-antigen/teichoic acid export membrane protein
VGGLYPAEMIAAAEFQMFRPLIGRAFPQTPYNLLNLYFTLWDAFLLTRFGGMT